jgi:hypothetical protein
MAFPFIDRGWVARAASEQLPVRWVGAVPGAEAEVEFVGVTKHGDYAIRVIDDGRTVVATRRPVPVRAIVGVLAAMAVGGALYVHRSEGLWPALVIAVVGAAAVGMSGLWLRSANEAAAPHAMRARFDRVAGTLTLGGSGVEIPARRLRAVVLVRGWKGRRHVVDRVPSTCLTWTHELSVIATCDVTGDLLRYHLVDGTRRPLEAMAGAIAESAGCPVVEARAPRCDADDVND